MSRSAIQLNVLRADLERENAAVVQTCVPLVDLKGDSYRLRDKDLGAPNRANSADLA
jgi:hypothetical protein